MNPSLIHPDYLARIGRLYGLAPETVSRLILHFLVGTPLPLMSADTRVDPIIIGRLLRSAWRTALRPDHDPHRSSGGALRFFTAKWTSERMTAGHLAVLADMHRMHAGAAAIHAYLAILGATWDSAHAQLRGASAGDG